MSQLITPSHRGAPAFLFRKDLRGLGFILKCDFFKVVKISVRWEPISYPVIVLVEQPQE